MIPVDPKSKKATVKWADYQDRIPTDQELEQWFGKGSPSMAIVTGGISQLCVIDVDSHKHPDAIEKIKPFLPEQETYPLAQSQSGGWHLYFKCNGELRGGVDMPFTGVDLRANGNYIICPPTPGYEWKRKIEDGGSNLLELSNEYIKELALIARPMPRNEDVSDFFGQTRTTSDTFMSAGSRDNDLFHVANLLARGGGNEEEIRQLLEILAKSCDPPFSEKETELKIQSALKRREDKKINLAETIREWVLSDNRTFNGQQTDNELSLRTPSDKDYRGKVLRRMVKDGLIEPVGDKRGYFRKIEKKSDKVEWMDANTTPTKINLPLGISDLVNLYPGNLIVIAGESNAGKTAFLLNVVRLNMNQGRKIMYATSEMDATELKVRLLLFEEEMGIPLEDWNSGFDVYERTQDFHDIIEPDAINIIDFFEISDSFYQIAGKLTKIWEKLKSGIVLVAIQKDPRSSLGRGGTFAMEKSRLYLNIMKNYPAGQIAYIAKGKNDKEGEGSSDGLEIGYTTRKGCLLTPHGNWYRAVRTS